MLILTANLFSFLPIFSFLLHFALFVHYLFTPLFYVYKFLFLIYFFLFIYFSFIYFSISLFSFFFIFLFLCSHLFSFGFTSLSFLKFINLPNVFRHGIIISTRTLVYCTGTTYSHCFTCYTLTHTYCASFLQPVG